MEVIAAAADVVIARPLLMLAPVLLDLYYLLGWRLTAGSTFDHLRTRALDQHNAVADGVAKYLDKAASVDVAGLVAFVIPSLFPDTTDKIYHPFERTAIALDNWGAFC